MKRYRFFTQRFGGGFGDLREASFANDAEALGAARQMLEQAQGIDVWDEINRVALIQREQEDRSAA